MTSDVNLNTAINQQQKTAAASTKLAEDFTQFLTLLTVQLQNQDPLSPMDTTEFTNQLVAFTGVEQQINTNQKLDSLVALQMGTAFSAAQNYVGKEISYLSTEFDFTGDASTIKYSMDAQATISKINIYDESGDLVYSVDGAKTAGVHEFTWDGTTKDGGKALPGTYEIKLDALDAAEEKITTSIVVSGKVRGTEVQNGEIFLLVGERAVSISSVLNTSSNNGNGTNNEALTMALSYVGLDINYMNNRIDYQGDGDTDIDYTLHDTADRAKILIKNDNGQTVYTADIPKGEGAHTFTWDGTLTDGSDAPAGEYTFVIDAIDADDQRITATTTATGRVTGVETENGQLYLQIGNRRVLITDVLSASQPDTNEA
jgi:flagellar basal-body rod modification protein FlgD